MFGPNIVIQDPRFPIYFLHGSNIPDLSFFRKNLVVLFRLVGHPKFIQFRCSEAYQRRSNEVSGVSRRNIEIHWEDHDILIVWQLKLITTQRSWVVVDLFQFPMMQCNVSLSIARVDYQKFGFASLPKKAVSRNNEFWDKLLLYLNLRWCDAFPAFSHDVIRRSSIHTCLFPLVGRLFQTAKT